MSYLQAILLAIIQGLTEFLPISSSGHLAFLQNIWEIPQPLFFDIALHFGTLIATIFFFRKTLLSLFQKFFSGERSERTFVFSLFIATIPIVFAGFFLQPIMENILRTPEVIAIGYLFTATMLFMLAKQSTYTAQPKDTRLPSLSYTNAFVVGLFQSFALFPGISRSGSTLFAGIWQKLSIHHAFTFSFLLSIPAILGALFLQFTKISFVSYLPQSIIGTLVSACVGFGALWLLEKLLLNRRLHIFGYYCLVASIVFAILAIRN